MFMVPVLQMRMVTSGHLLVIEPGLEPVTSGSRALLLNLTLPCFPSLCCKAGFPRLSSALGAEWLFVTALGTVGCSAASLALTLWMPTVLLAPAHLVVTTPHVSRHYQISLGGCKITTIENHYCKRHPTPCRPVPHPRTQLLLEITWDSVSVWTPCLSTGSLTTW